MKIFFQSFARRTLGVALMGLVLLALPFCVASAGAAGSADSVEFDIQPRIVNLGETATATLTFRGNTAPEGGISLPAMDGLSIQSAGTIQQNINGARSLIYSYRIVPRRTGDFTFGPFTLNAGTAGVDPMVLPQITLSVRAGADGADEQGEMIFARLQTPDTPPCIHQGFDLILGIYSLPSVELTRDVSLLGGFPESGFVIGGFEELQSTREEVDGRIYNLRRFRARARALTAGDFEVAPVLRVGIVDRSQSQRRRQSPFGDSFFNDPFFNPVSATPVQLPVAATTLHIQPLPVEGRPAGFTGAVGQFRFDVEAKPRELKIGEPITVTLRLSGRGNIASALPPSYADTDLYKTYEARQAGEAPDAAAESGAKTFEQVVIPRSTDLAELPALSFAYFDPDAGAYRILSAGPFPLTVHASETGSNALLMQIPGGDHESHGRALVLGTDIVYIQPAPARWSTSSRSAVVPVLLSLGFGLPPLALAGLAFATRRRQRLASDIAFARRQKAPRAARAGLRRASAALVAGTSANESPTALAHAVFEPLADAAAHYFGHRLNLPPGAVDPPCLLKQFEASGLPAASLERWRAFWELSDRIRYGAAPALTCDNLREWIQTIETLLREAERTRLS